MENYKTVPVLSGYIITFHTSIKVTFNLLNSYIKASTNLIIIYNFANTFAFNYD
jgi:hypothetical protein